jgi:glycosyltransferase involved in cell wall biosynthesis
MKFFLYVQGNPCTSMATWGRNTQACLTAHGHDVQSFAPKTKLPEAKDLDYILMFGRPDLRKSLLHGPKNTVLCTTWEWGSVTTEARKLLEGFRAVVVPSTYTQRVLHEAGIEALVAPIGHMGFYQDKLPHAKPRLFFSGAWENRNNIHGLLRAFCRVVGEQELFIKAWSGLSLSQADFDDVIQYADVDHSHAIFFITSIYPEAAKVLDNLANMDVFVSAARGSGYSLAALEAMATGVPVIAPEGLGFDEYLTPECSWRIPVVEKDNTDGAIQWLPKVRYVEPDADKLAETIALVCQDRSEVRRKATEAVARARDFTAEKCTERLLDVLGKI